MDSLLGIYHSLYAILHLRDCDVVLDAKWNERNGVEIQFRDYCDSGFGGVPVYSGTRESGNQEFVCVFVCLLYMFVVVLVML